MPQPHDTASKVENTSCVLRPRGWKNALELILLREEAFPSFYSVLGITGLSVVEVTWGFKGSPYHLSCGESVHALAIPRKVTSDSLCSPASEMFSQSKSQFYRPKSCLICSEEVERGIRKLVENMFGQL